MATTGIKDDITQCIGNTPLVRLRRITEGCVATVVGKIENMNPLWSVKDRIARAMIDAAERDGKIKPDTVIIEPTSGNTGIGLAYVCAARGYRFMVTMPESMSLERRRLLKALGAELVLTPAAEGMPGAVRKAEELRGAEPELLHAAAVQEPGQSRRSIARRPPKKSGATPTARSTSSSPASAPAARSPASREVLKKRKPGFKAIAVEPANSPVITQKKAGQPLKPGRHTIQGIGAGFIPDVLNVDIIDEVVQVNDEDAMETARQLGEAGRPDVRHQLRRRRLGRDASRQAAGERRQADRRRPARHRRTLSLDEVVPGMNRR